MIQVSNLDSDAKQNTAVVLADGTAVVLAFAFRAATQRWKVDVTYNGKTYAGLGLCLHPNLLRGFRGVLPFGIFCSSIDGLDPYSVDDFSTGRVSVYILDSTFGNTEVQNVETDFFSI